MPPKRPPAAAPGAPAGTFVSRSGASVASLHHILMQGYEEAGAAGAPGRCCSCSTPMNCDSEIGRWYR